MLISVSIRSTQHLKLKSAFSPGMSWKKRWLEKKRIVHRCKFRVNKMNADVWAVWSEIEMLKWTYTQSGTMWVAMDIPLFFPKYRKRSALYQTYICTKHTSPVFLVLKVGNYTIINSPWLKKILKIDLLKCPRMAWYFNFLIIIIIMVEENFENWPAEMPPEWPNF